MAHPIRQLSSAQVQTGFLRQIDPDKANKTPDAIQPEIPFTPVSSKISNREQFIDRQLAALTKQVGVISAGLQQIDNKWSRQFAGFQETASITAEAVIGFENELEKQKDCLAQFGALLSKNIGAVNARSNLSAPALENVIQEFAAYRSNVQAKLTTLYVGFGVLALGLFVTVALVAVKL